MSDDSGRISVSRDALRAELLSLKLDLIQQLATKGEVDRLNDRINDHGRRLTSLERREDDDDAIRNERSGAFTRREKLWGMTLATCALCIQILIVTGVIR